ncbi:MAG: hypothetical protein ACP6IQ_05150 [Candidatus Njordarchaeia archaeon]
MMPKKWKIIILVALVVVLISNISSISSINIASRANINRIESKLVANQELKIVGANDYTMDYSYTISNKWAVDQAYDVASGFLYGYSDNGFYVVGAIQQEASAYTDVFIQKIDTTGNVVWNVTYDYKGYSDVARGVCFANDGPFIYVTGFVEGSGAEKNVTLLKVNRTDGTIIWAKTWGTSSKKEYGMAVMADSRWNKGYGIYVAGYVEESGGDSDILVVKFDTNGNEVWSATYDGGYDDFAEDIHATYNGIITVAGATSNGTTYGGILLRYDYNGNLERTYTEYSNSGSVIFHRLFKPIVQGDYIYVTSQVTLPGGNYVAELARIDNSTFIASGAIIFPETSKFSAAYGIYTDKGTANFYITGYVQNGYNKDEFFWKVDVNSFDTISVSTYDSGYNDTGYGISGYITNEGVYFFIVAGTQTYSDVYLHQIYNWNIWSPDVDDDNLSNFYEMTHGTNMTNPDTDSDGMPDGWEVQYNLNATDPSDANRDPDHDGLTNLQEYQNGKDPTIDDVLPTINSIWTTPNVPNNATPTVIYASVEDANGLSSVNLTYYLNGEEHNVTMNFNSTSGYYYYSLGMLEAGTNVTYFVIANDTAGNIRVSTMSSFIVTAVSGESPPEETPSSGENEGNQLLEMIPPQILIAGFAIVVIITVVAFLKRRR